MLASGAAAALLLFRPPIIWWAVVALTIGAVLAVELMNSAFEALVDHLHPDRHPEIRIIKDMDAGGVLLVSLGALVVGGLLILFELWR